MLRKNAVQQAGEKLAIGLLKPGDVAQVRLDRRLIVATDPPLVEALQRKLTSAAAR